MKYCQKHGIDHFQSGCPWCEIEKLQTHLAVAKEALEDFRDHGMGADPNPTQPVLDWNQVFMFFVGYLRQIDGSVRERARAALEKLEEKE